MNWKDRKKTQERNQKILESIYTLLSYLWVMRWIRQQVEFPDDASEKIPHGRMIQRNHLEELRKQGGGYDASHQPEKAYSYLTIHQLCESWLWPWYWITAFSTLGTLCFAAVVFEQEAPAPGVIYLILFACILVTSIVLYKATKNNSDYKRYEISTASKYLGRSWGEIRKICIEIGLIGRIQEQLMRCPPIAVAFMTNSQSLITSIAQGQYIKSIFLKLLEDIAVPYVKSQKSGKAVSEEDIQVKEKFEASMLLVPYFCPGEKVCKVRETVYNAAKDRIVSGEEGKTPEEFPTP